MCVKYGDMCESRGGTLLLRNRKNGVNRILFNILTIILVCEFIHSNYAHFSFNSTEDRSCSSSTIRYHIVCVVGL